MIEPFVVAVAISDAVPCTADNPAVQTTPQARVEPTHAAFEADASLVHIHVRAPDDSPSSDHALFAAVQADNCEHRLGMIVHFSTCGCGRDPALHAAPRLGRCGDIGWHQSEVMDCALARGAVAIRTGLEDNVRVSRHRLAWSNAELVAFAADQAHPARRLPAEDCQVLGLAPA